MKKSKIVALITSVTSSIALLAFPIKALAIEPPVISIMEEGDIVEILGVVTDWVLGLAGAIAVLYLIYGGITYITGGEKGATAGKTMITNAIIGIAIIALSIVIVKAVLQAIGA